MRFRGIPRHGRVILGAPRTTRGLALPTRVALAGVPRKPQLDGLPVLRERGATVAAGYDYLIANAARLRAAVSAYLNFTNAGASADRKKFTISIWFKRGILTTRQVLYSINSAGAAGATNQITISLENAGSNADTINYNNGSLNRTSTAVLRDPTGFQHFHQAFDTTQAIAADRVKTSINNALLSDINIGQDFSLNDNTPFGQAAVAQYLGRRDSGLHFDGLIAEVHIIDGQALPPTSFGRLDPVSGLWIPKSYTGSHGANGAFLEFKDASAATAATFGKDTAPNDGVHTVANNWTPNNISVAAGVTFDQSADTPTTNYATINPLDVSSLVPSWANTRAGMANGYGWRSTIGVTSGIWVIEATLTTASTDGSVGISNSSAFSTYLGSDTNGIAYNAVSGTVTKNGATVATYSAWNTSGKVIGVKLDRDAGTVEFFVDGTSQGTPISHGITGTLFFAQKFATGNGTPVFDINFGQRPFAYPNAYGSAKKLCVANLASEAVTLSGTFTGNASADGPVLLMNGTPATLTINGNAVTWGTHADKIAGGVKLRTSSASYNAVGANSWVATAGPRLVATNGIANTAQVNP